MMKRFIFLSVCCCCLVQWTLADVLYTKSGDTYSGSIESITRQEVLFRISRGGFEYEVRAFPVGDVLEILDDKGNPVPFLFPPESKKVTDTSMPAEPITTKESVTYRFSWSKTYSRWPLLVGTVVFSTIGIYKLSSAASEYDDIRRDEQLGYEVTHRKDEAARERLWGELSLAAGAVCLVLAITPEKIRKPMLSSVQIRHDWAGIAFSLPLK